MAPLALAFLVLLALTFVRPSVQRIPLDAACTLRLVASNESEDPSYEVLLVRGSQEQTLLRHPSLALVAQDLGRILDATGLSVEESAGIPVQYLRSTGEATRRDHRENSTIVGVASASHQRASAALVGGTMFVLLVFAWALLKAQARVSPLSVALPSVCAILFGTFGAWMNSKRWTVRVSDAGVDAEESALGMRRRLFSIPAHELFGAVVVERGEVAVEVLIATSRGPKLLPLVGDAARRVADAIGHIPSATDARAPAHLPSSEPPPFDTRSAGRAAESRRDARRGTHPEVARARQS